MMQLIESSAKLNGSELSFDDFWILFPRHVAKKDARLAWEKLKPDFQMTALVALVEWRQVWIRRNEMEFTPYPASWLRGERWDDELPADFQRSQISPASHQPFKPETETARAPMPDKLRAVLAELKRKST